MKSSKNIDTFLDCRLTFDGDKISEKFKIYPINYGFSEEYKESEECIIVTNSFHIDNYLIKVEIPDEYTFYKEILRDLTYNNI
jgi:hypothetical protein